MRTRDTIVGNWGSSNRKSRLPQGRAADGRPNLASAIFTRMPPSMGQPTMMPQVTVTRPATSLDRIFMTSSNWSWLSSLPDLLSFAYCARTSSTEWRFGGLTAPMTRMALFTCAGARVSLAFVTA